MVYSLRNPVDRIVSQHHHQLSRGSLSDANVDTAVPKVPELLDYSRYATQVQPFLDAVGRDRVHLVAFEDYVSDRSSGFADLARFLRLPTEHTTTDPERPSTPRRATTSRSAAGATCCAAAATAGCSAPCSRTGCGCASGGGC